MISIGVIGYGYWGPNIVRNFQSLDLDCVKMVSDLNPKVLGKVKHLYPSIRITTDPGEILRSKEIDAVAVITPVATHYPLVREALENGKHVFVEKPFTAKADHAEELIELADRKNLKIMVDYTFLFTGAVKKTKELIDNGTLGKIYYYDSMRVNLGLFQTDVNVIWDLAPHDLSIMKYIIPDKEVAGVTACGVSNYYELENLAQVSLHFQDKSCFAHFHVNWTSPVKIRKMIIAGNKKMLVYDDMENSEKIKIYNSSVDVSTAESLHDTLVQYRTGDMCSPKIEQVEALSAGVTEFVNCIINDRQPLTNAYDGLEIVKILEASDISIKNTGAYVGINNKQPYQAKQKVKVEEYFQ